MNLTKSQKARNSKLEVTLRQWKRIESKEIGISEDLRNVEVLEQAKMMIVKIELDMSPESFRYCK